METFYDALSIVNAIIDAAYPLSAKTQADAGAAN